MKQKSFFKEKFILPQEKRTLLNTLFFFSADVDQQGSHKEKSADSTEDVYQPVLSSSAPELQGEWTEVKKRAKEKRDKKKEKVNKKITSSV